MAILPPYPTEAHLTHTATLDDPDRAALAALGEPAPVTLVSLVGDDPFALNESVYPVHIQTAKSA